MKLAGDRKFIHVCAVIVRRETFHKHNAKKRLQSFFASHELAAEIFLRLKIEQNCMQLFTSEKIRINS